MRPTKAALTYFINRMIKIVISYNLSQFENEKIIITPKNPYNLSSASSLVVCQTLCEIVY